MGPFPSADAFASSATFPHKGGRLSRSEFGFLMPQKFGAGIQFHRKSRALPRFENNCEFLPSPLVGEGGERSEAEGACAVHAIVARSEEK